MQFISISEASGIGRITLNRPELHNAFNDEMIQELHTAFEHFSHSSSVHVVVLQAEGRSFCAGADLNWMKRMIEYTFEENVADAKALSLMLKAIKDCAKPVIARVHGAAFGGGVGLVSACDIALATTEATFSLSEVKLGLLPAVISPFVLDKIQAKHARRYFLTAERFSAAEAHRIGLISEVVDSIEALDAQLEGLCKALLANGPEAVSICKNLIQEVSEADSWESQLNITTQRIAERRASTEGQEGMGAFLDKRTPKWIESPSYVS